MNDELIKRAKTIISKILYITIATSNKLGIPWNTPVYSAFDKDYNFYWISWRKNQHSKNIKENSQIFIVIYDSTAVEGQGHGVYIQAKAYELDDNKEVEYALKYLDGRINKTGRHKASQFQGSKPRRIYKAVPEKVWVNTDIRINGEFVDDRIEINLN
ncbi:MAG: hypothetical protein UT12_C0011G0043 [Candidatus Curtissbacteria bacterium GW2011_GWC2_38_9]|uniref:Pyridoxamine 5'-phosphate oxidase N-terminal domain-containing protein n=3 Tax=Candidatus Curtissiibacteriota TaxID=1752717 RepID=A0A1F5HV25_9BACT|nr:MAG: hypothetical protein UT12_C0011G0043 [Candidatus Curtissbacteria bacterium GW2011_GWC2_38_9]KKS05068.1 MAG: hypothetical protein UU56_C0001G0035 [Candidatus Curtissbacteria bacterium GW2011_GWA2_41_24]OGD90636.1 MAG: hypothetical protein A2Z54_01585 [Candidatus Curtissbacteria bacterium RIFCSPHIGHO2_02_39_8]OGE07916.1 MAG: hypothetical protein A2W70_00490 [Candidatus Curtissbacteria bacterium RIFCSPLOWO2_02_41_11]